MHVMAIVRALSLPGVRQAAVETLDQMGPVAGDKEPGCWPPWRLCGVGLQTPTKFPVCRTSTVATGASSITWLSYFGEAIGGSEPWRPPSYLALANPRQPWKLLAIRKPVCAGVSLQQSAGLESRAICERLSSYLETWERRRQSSRECVEAARRGRRPGAAP